MSEHHVSVTVDAPLHQVYTLFTHFNDFPKFMSFVKEVTYYDEQRSHWVAQFAGTHEWDAVNEDWLPDQQVGWRSTRGLENRGRVKFTSLAANQQTRVDVYLSYTPPAGVIGAAIEPLGIDSHFDNVLRQDLQHFATMVEQAPAEALDPMQSHYLWHADSALARGAVTAQQQASMSNDPMMSREALRARERTIERENAEQQQAEQERTAAQVQHQQLEQHAAEEQTKALRQQAEEDQRAMQAQRQQQPTQPTEPHPIYDTIGGRNASMERTAFGDQDAQRERFPLYYQDPMMSHAPEKRPNMEGPIASEVEIASPWRVAPHEQASEDEQARQQRREAEEERDRLQRKATRHSEQEDHGDTASN